MANSLRQRGRDVSKLNRLKDRAKRKGAAQERQGAKCCFKERRPAPAALVVCVFLSTQLQRLAQRRFLVMALTRKMHFIIIRRAPIESGNFVLSNIKRDEEHFETRSFPIQPTNTRLSYTSYPDMAGATVRASRCD